MNHLNYHQLYYFYIIAQEKSLASASKKILISVPALSMQLKELEDQVGTQLFHRKGKGVELTEIGHFVYDYAKDIFKLGKELQDNLSDKAVGKRRPKIEIGCEDSIPKFILEELVEFIFRLGGKVVVREAPLEQLLHMQNNFELDLILIHSQPHNHFDDSKTKCVFKEQLVLVCSPLMKKKVMSSKEMIPLIHNYSRPLSSIILEKYAFKGEREFEVVAELEDHQTEIDLARKGHGVVITHPSTVKRYFKERKLVKLQQLDLIDEVWMLLGPRKKTNELAYRAMNEFILTK